MMELWPFTNFHDLNLDWIISVWKKVEKYLEHITEYMLRAETAADDSEHAAEIAEAAKNEILSRYHATPQAYGAVGDGITDDTAAIQEMFDETDAPVYFPPGKYLVTSGLNDTETGRPIYMEGSIVYNGAGAAITTTNKYNVFIVINVESTVSDFTAGSIGARLINCNNCTIIIKKAKGFEEGIVYEGDNAGFAYNKTWAMLLLNNMYGLHGKGVGTGWVNENQWYGGRYTVESSKTWRNQATGILMEGTATHIINDNTFYNPCIESIGTGVKFVKTAYSKVIDMRAENTTTPFEEEDTLYNSISIMYGPDYEVYNSGVNSVKNYAQTAIDPGFTSFETTGNLIGKIASNTNYAASENLMGLDNGAVTNYLYKVETGPNYAPLIPSGRSVGIVLKIDPNALYHVAIKSSNACRYGFLCYDEDNQLITSTPKCVSYAGGITNLQIPTSGPVNGGFATGADVDDKGLYLKFPANCVKCVVAAVSAGHSTEVYEIAVRSTSPVIENITDGVRAIIGAPTSTALPGQFVVDTSNNCYIYDGAAWKTITTS